MNNLTAAIKTLKDQTKETNRLLEQTKELLKQTPKKGDTMICIKNPKAIMTEKGAGWKPNRIFKIKTITNTNENGAPQTKQDKNTIFWPDTTKNPL